MTRLKQYFPMIRERQEILDEIRNRKELEQQFDNWSKEQQEEFLDFCSGVKGLNLLYDGFLKILWTRKRSRNGLMISYPRCCGRK